MIYSTRLLGAILAAGGTTTFVVPAGLVAVIRSISFTPTGAGVTGAGVQIEGSGYIWHTATGTSGDVQTWEGRQVANAGETLEGFVTGAAATLLVSGYLLSV